MRVSKETAAANRERILEAAGRLFRERGLASTGVDALSEAAGLSHGSLYSQFGSKERLAAEALAHAAAGGRAKFAAVDDLADYARRYLSPQHRDQRSDGCAIAALAGEMPQQGDPVRRKFTQGVEAMTERVASLMPPGATREADALAVVAATVGALVLARGVDDRELSDRILAACVERVAKI